ncbi:hypothetical protein EIP91_006394 [Steccherinum ochraceum]|uniref:Essential protein Yae1 N-terminal domain-containing protein n=1 Tax=Steccherinum ochraceum TaxID=92696 RepID=A0A4R0R5S2_9APHY|nr:hypothetical protein EIP91_006394 [Steccherinum ochraceum]
MRLSITPRDKEFGRLCFEHLKDGDVTNAENTKHQAELDVARNREEIAKSRAQVDVLERDLRRAEDQVQKLERLKSELEYAVTDAKEAARKAQQGLREWQAREEGRDEGWKINVMRRYNDGREDGFEDGRAEGYETGHAEGYEEGHEAGTSEGRTEGYNAGRLAGFEEGKNVGWQEGFEEGLERGRKEAREEALRAFDKFVASEFESRPGSFVDDGEPEEDRTQEWVETTRKSLNRSGSHSSHGVSREPDLEPVQEVYPEPPQQPAVWLHRRLNSNALHFVAPPPVLESR